MDVPFYGNLILCAVLVACAYTFAMAMGAARGRPHFLLSARYGTYATCALVVVGVALLAYAFQTHDFRIRYVARYSDRSMSWWYLFTSLWGGQDGSLLWWSFLLCGYTSAVTRWMRGRYLELQPWVLATLMSILAFFILLMLFAANPFATFVAAAPGDGEGLNPLLQNYWMTIHPPTLYLGFVGWSVPFAFVVAALATGRVGEEWLTAVRRWALVAWLFLSIGLTLGMLWSYEELGWGGYWAWDPVENASFMPWLVGTAYVHSALIQERYGMMKVWNVFLLCLTFFMTIFGTFLTRSGMISSVHSFARSDIGIWFVVYLIILVVFIFLLIAWRLPELRGKKIGVTETIIAAIIGVVPLVAIGGAKLVELVRSAVKPPRGISTYRPPQLQSLLSREFAFLLNNWVFLFVMVIVLALTTYPLVTEWVEGQQATVGPPVYNAYLIPFGLVLLCLMAVGPMVSWRKATGENLMRGLLIPTIAGVVVACLHIALGEWLGFPPRVEVEPIYDTRTGDVLAAIGSVAPTFATSFCAFVVGTVVQEFVRGTAVRMRKGENAFVAFFLLVAKARRRYGGYVIHLGIVSMFVGFTGAAYDIEKEAALRPGESLRIGDGRWRGGYEIRYDGSTTAQDRNKRMIFTELTVLDWDGDEVGRASPAKFIYTTHPEMPTTEVSIRSRPVNDLYMIMSTVDPRTHRATFRVVLRPLVIWIWIGGLILILGTIIAIFPSIKELLREREPAKRPPARPPPAAGKGSAAKALLLLLGLLLMGPWTGRALAQSDSSSSLHAGTVEITDPRERRLFQRLLCQCGDCARLPMDSCGCGWAEDKRAELRQRLAAGDDVVEIVDAYRAQYGAAGIAVPPDEGIGRAMWAVPIVLGLLAVFGIATLGRRWRRARPAPTPAKTGAAAAASEEEGPDAKKRYEAMLDEELRRLEGE